MRASEFINEGKKGKVPKRHHEAQPGAYRFMDDATNTTYHLNRIMMATAMSDGSSTNPLKMDDESFVGKNNMAYPFTDLEHNMMQQAFNTVNPTNAKTLIRDRSSVELDDVHKVSPIKGFKGY